MSTLVYGIDFGTTNSSIAVIDLENQQKEPQVLSIKGSQITKSVIFFPQASTKVYVGEEAIQKYLACGMKGRFLQSVKSALPDDGFTHTMIRGQRYTIEDLISIVIRLLKEEADKITGQDVKHAVIGRPAAFSPDPRKDALAQERLETAAKNAGFEQVAFQLEPIAAAFHYEATLAKPETVLVADLGGGTSDFTVIQLSPEKKNSTSRLGDIAATSGVYVGGDNLDSRLTMAKAMKYFGSETSYGSGNKWLHVPHRLTMAVCDWRKLSFIKDDRFEQELIKIISKTANDQKAISNLQTLINHDLGFTLRQVVEKAKCELSKQAETAIRFHQSGIDFDEPVDMNGFEKIISSEVGKIESCVTETLERSGLNPAGINSVFMTGGTSYVPMIRRMFADTFGSDKIKSGDAFISVVSGLALSAKLFY